MKITRQLNHCAVMRSLTMLLIVGLSVAMVGCGRSKQPQFRIGVSQCSDDAWRQKMNQELLNEQIFHPELAMHFRQACDNSMLQCQQIDSFIAEKVDLLIVCPNEAAEVKPAVDRAFDAGIPVVVADRRVRGDKWTAHIGGDNIQVGYLMADWLERLESQRTEAERKRPLRVIEIVGLPGSTPAEQRHEGLMRGIAGMNIEIAGSATGLWFYDPAFAVCDSLLNCVRDVDAIVVQNDVMARGVVVACNRHNIRIPIMGVDGITGKGGGIEAVLTGLIDVTATYASRGDLVLQTAADILSNRPYEREVQLQSVLIGKDEARPIALLAEERENEIEAIKMLQNRVSDLNNEISWRQMFSYILVAVIGLLLLLIVIAWRIMVYRTKIRRERKAYLEETRRQQEQLEALTAELAEVKMSRLSKSDEDEAFLRALQEHIEKNMDDTELSVDSLARDMGMSRTVLFRKVKNATGQSPVELLRHIRMRRAKELLENSNLSVSQVAYMVGYSAPSYFAKCYKDEFGVVPSEHK